MSDQAVRAAIEQMETWLADPAWEPDPDLLAQWSAGFQAAMAKAGKGAGWTDLTTRAHHLGEQLELRTRSLVQLQAEVRAELDAMERGSRALRGYGIGAR